MCVPCANTNTYLGHYAGPELSNFYGVVVTKQLVAGCTKYNVLESGQDFAIKKKTGEVCAIDGVQPWLASRIERVGENSQRRNATLVRVLNSFSTMRASNMLVVKITITKDIAPGKQIYACEFHVCPTLVPCVSHVSTMCVPCKYHVCTM